MEIHDTIFQNNTGGSQCEGSGAICASGAQVLLVQTTAVSNTPSDYGGSTFTHHCYDGFYHNVDSANSDQCLAGRYKNFTLEPNAISCKDCPEVLYLYSLCTVLTMHCTYNNNNRAGTATPPSPRPPARTARSAQPGTTDQAPAQLSAPLAQQVGTGNSPARRASHALPSARRTSLQRAHREPRAQWRPSSGFTWRMLRLRSRDRVQRANSNQA
jgi:hypothetical protein